MCVCVCSSSSSCIYLVHSLYHSENKQRLTRIIHPPSANEFRKVYEKNIEFIGFSICFSPFCCRTGACRRRCLSILKTLRDRHLDLPGNPVTSYHMKTLLLYECEKHPREAEWEDNCIADRINGIFMQLISCLQCRRCPHYFLPNMDLFKGKSPGALENAARQVWRLLRIMLTNTRCLEEL